MQLTVNNVRQRPGSQTLTLGSQMLRASLLGPCGASVHALCQLSSLFPPLQGSLQPRSPPGGARLSAPHYAPSLCFIMACSVYASLGTPTTSLQMLLFHQAIHSTSAESSILCFSSQCLSHGQQLGRRAGLRLQLFLGLYWKRAFMSQSGLASFSSLEKQGEIKINLRLYCLPSNSFMKTLNHIKRAKEVVTTSLILIGECKMRRFPQAISPY